MHRSSAQGAAVLELAAHTVAEQRGGEAFVELMAHLAFDATQNGIFLTVFDFAVTAARMTAKVGGIDEIIHLVAKRAEGKGGRTNELA
jgi:hypothetical protein